MSLVSNIEPPSALAPVILRCGSDRGNGDVGGCSNSHGRSSSRDYFYGRVHLGKAHALYVMEQIRLVAREAVEKIRAE